MNILLINHYAGSPEMGMEFRPYYFAREWIKMGHRVDIIAADYSHLRRINPDVSKDFQEEMIDGIHYHWIRTGEYEGNGAKRAVTMAKFITKLWLHTGKIIREMDPDVVICSSTYPLDTYVGQRIRRKSGKKVKLIHEVHDMWPATLIEIGGMSENNPFVVAMQIGENSAYKHSDKVVSLLPNAEPYMREHGLAEGKFKCIPNGIVLEEWENPEEIPEEHRTAFEKLKAQGKFIVGYFGGHALSNALDSIIDTAETIDDEDVHFILVGDGVEKKRLMKRVEDLRLTNVTFLPPVNKKSIPKLCESFDCVYMCGLDSPLYRFGVCPNKMFDIMASGKPGICALGVKSYFSEYGCGFDVESTDIPGICSLIERLKTCTPVELEKISELGHKASREKFNYSKLSEEFLSILED